MIDSHRSYVPFWLLCTVGADLCLDNTTVAINAHKKMLRRKRRLADATDVDGGPESAHPDLTLN